MKIYKRFNITCTDTRSVLSEALEFIRVSLEKMSLDTKEANRAQLMSEEALVRLAEHGDFEHGGTIHVSIRQFMGRVSVNLAVPGKEFDFAKSLEFIAPLDVDSDEDMPPESASVIQNILLRSFEDRLKYRHSNNCNYISITAVRSPFTGLFITLGAFILAVILAFLLKAFASPEVCNILNDKFLVPIRTVFLNGLKLCSVPVVFLAIASCTAQFGDVSEIKKIGSRLLICFVIMQFVSACLGVGIFYLFPKSGYVIKAAESLSPAVSQGASLSIIDTLVNLVPSNIIKPFLDGDMLQLIILSVLVGISTGITGANTIRNLLDECNKIFMKITGALMRFIPLVVFCSMASLILTTGADTLLSILGLVVMTFTGYGAVMLTYAVITAFWCRLNPLHLFSKSLPMFLTALSTSSSVASIPDSMKCSEKLGIPSKIYSLSIPLGFSINKNALCMYVAAACLFLANIYGVEVSVPAMFMLVFSLTLLILGSPNVSGGVFIIFSVLLAQLGVPVEAVSLLIGINPFLDMFETPVNCFGTMASTLITTERSGMLDREIYNRTAL